MILTLCKKQYLNNTTNMCRKVTFKTNLIGQHVLTLVVVFESAAFNHDNGRNSYESKLLESYFHLNCHALLFKGKIKFSECIIIEILTSI